MTESYDPGAKKDPEVATEELKASEETIDPRLDNRTGDQRPPLETFPAKPQQVDGPSIENHPTAKEAAQIVHEKQEGNGPDGVARKGMHSPGPHGLGTTEAPQFDEGAEVADDRAKTAAEQAKTNEG